MTECPEKWYESGKECGQCKDNCLECTNNADCTKCDFGYYIDNSGDLPECSKCKIDDCKICNKPDTCVSCFNGKYYDGEVFNCVNTCHIGSYGDGESGVCENCNSMCSTCNKSSTNC